MASSTEVVDMNMEEVHPDNNEREDCEEEEEEEEDEEPKLKYERIGNALQEILFKDATSCMSVHPKFLSLGTHWGVIYIFDHQGNNIHKFPSHTTSINQISIDAFGEYVASCSEDGRVVINGLYTSENNSSQTFDCPIRSVGLHPEFGRHGNKQYVIGIGEKLTLFEKTWLRNKSTVLHVGEGYVRSIKWRKNFIAWANSQGVEVYDTNTKLRITHIQRDPGSPRDDLFHCHICWKDDRTLLIAWADKIKICVVKQRAVNDIRDLPTHYVEIANMFNTDFYACGIAPFGEELAILAYFLNKDDGGMPQKGTALRPQLLVLLPKSIDSYIETSTDALSVRGFEEYLCNNYFLENVQEEKLFYIVSPKDIVIARPCDMDDHISWLMDQKKYKEAYSEAIKKQRELKQHEVMNIGKVYLNYLIIQEMYKEAALECERVLGENKELWQNQIYIFQKHHKLRILTPYIPIVNPQLDSTIYEMVLNEHLQKDFKGFHQLIKEWPGNLYRSETIIYAIQSKLQEYPKESELLQSLATLYANQKRYGEALQIYLELGHNDVFDMIYKHNLLDYIQEKYLQLMEIDNDKATTMFIDNIEKIPVESVVKRLKKDSKSLHQYLHKLFLKDPQSGQEFHDLQVELYAEFERPRLLPFLRNSHFYHLEKAFEICKERKFIEEMVFLLGRMGNNKKALSLIMDQLNDIQKAIDFAKEENDEELWEDLINESLDKPEFIKELLVNIGTHVDPIKLIKRIRNGMEIPSLRDALVKILHDFNLQVSLHEGCKTILDKDSVDLIQRQVKVQARGYSVLETDKCHACQGTLVVNDTREASDLTYFFCQHKFHDNCLKQTAQMEQFCPICASRKSTNRKKTMSRGLIS